MPGAAALPVTHAPVMGMSHAKAVTVGLPQNGSRGIKVNIFPQKGLHLLLRYK